MRRSDRNPFRRRGRALGPLLLLTLAVAASAWGGLLAWGLWHRLPTEQSARLTGAQIDAARDARFKVVTRDLYEALLMNDLAGGFFPAWRGETTLSDYRARLSAAAESGVRSPVLRLMQLAVTLAEQERAGGLSWPEAANYLRGLGNADFRHNLADVERFWCDVFNRLDLGAATARSLAALYRQNHYNPLIEFLDARLLELARQQRSRGANDAAALCDQVAERMLAQWVLEPGSPGLRLTAADLLAARFEYQAAHGPHPERGEVSAALRRWRETYMSRYVDPPGLYSPIYPALDVLSPNTTPIVAPQAWRGYAGGLLHAAWLLAAATAAAALTLLTSWAWVRSLPRRRGGGWIDGLIALLAATAVIGGAYLFPSWAESIEFDDLRRLLSPGELGLPWVVIVASGVTVVLIVLAGMIAPRPLPGFGQSATVVWLATSVALIVVCIGTERARLTYERETGAALEQPFHAVAGAEAEADLDPLRRLPL